MLEALHVTLGQRRAPLLRVATAVAGTHKDLLARHLALRAPKDEPVSLVTSGSLGASLQFLRRRSGAAEVRALLPGNVPSYVDGALRRIGCRTYRSDRTESELLAPEDVLAITENERGTFLSTMGSPDLVQVYDPLVECIADYSPTLLMVPYGTGMLFHALRRRLGEGRVVPVSVASESSPAFKIYGKWHELLVPEDLQLVGEDAVFQAMRLAGSNGIAMEPSSAVALAHLIERPDLLAAGAVALSTGFCRITGVPRRDSERRALPAATATRRLELGAVRERRVA